MSKPDQRNGTIRRPKVGILGATPAGVSAAITIAELGMDVLLIHREKHPGGLMANGLGATDIGTRGATTGNFKKFVDSVDQHYKETFGANSPERKLASEGYHFEPKVAESIFQKMLQTVADRVKILSEKTFHAIPTNVRKSDVSIRSINIEDNHSGKTEWHEASAWIDATYEGDLAAAAGASFKLGREGFEDYKEPMAGKIYRSWGNEVLDGSTGEGDDRIQSYNYRLCLTPNRKNLLPFEKPENYDRSEYISLIDDYTNGRSAGFIRNEYDYSGIGYLTNMVLLPCDKTDANNQHLALISTDLPEENNMWPTANWDWRDSFARRLREYTEGLFFFAATDPAVPHCLQTEVSKWGWAADEYQDNGNFPRQVYVREGRRLDGKYVFTAHDALPVDRGCRPPVHRDSITASHYALDSHATQKRESGKEFLEGIFSYRTRPYTVPYRVMLPKDVEGLLVPVAASASHVGFSTLRMEPCWMAMGEAAGVAAFLAVSQNTPMESISLSDLQHTLLKRGTTLIYQKGDDPSKEGFAERQLELLDSGRYTSE